MPADDTVSVRHIVIGGALIAGTVALIAGVVVAGLTHWQLPLAGPNQADYTLPAMTPALESAPQPDLRRSRDDRRTLLTTSAWVDRGAGIARIPIATAMTLLSESGLRAAPAASAASAAIAARATTSAPSSAKDASGAAATTEAPR
jgi:hypothetical protein